LIRKNQEERKFLNRVSLGVQRLRLRRGKKLGPRQKGV